MSRDPVKAALARGEAQIGLSLLAQSTRKLAADFGQEMDATMGAAGFAAY